MPEATEQLRKMLFEKGFTVFCDVNHQDNAKGVDLDIPASRVLIFGNPITGTKLMQIDITISLDLPLHTAIIDDGQTVIIHQTTEDYCKNYKVEHQPVLEKFESFFQHWCQKYTLIEGYTYQALIGILIL